MDPSTLARKPLGGSLVIFTLGSCVFCCFFRGACFLMSYRGKRKTILGKQELQGPQLSHPVLQQQGRELLGGHGGQPKSVVVVRVIRVHLLTDPLELGEPGDGEVAVAKEHPAPALPGLLDHLGRLGSFHECQNGVRIETQPSSIILPICTAILIFPDPLVPPPPLSVFSIIKPHPIPSHPFPSLPHHWSVALKTH